MKLTIILIFMVWLELALYSNWIFELYLTLVTHLPTDSWNYYDCQKISCDWTLQNWTLKPPRENSLNAYVIYFLYSRKYSVNKCLFCWGSWYSDFEFEVVNNKCKYVISSNIKYHKVSFPHPTANCVWCPGQHYQR